MSSLPISIYHRGMKMLSKKSKSITLILILLSFLVTSFQNCAENAVQFERLPSSLQRSIKLDAESMENNQSVKVLFVIDDSNSMNPAQDKLNQKITQLVENLSNLNAEFGAITTNMSSIQMTAVQSSEQTTNESSTGYTRTYSSQNRAYVKMTSNQTVQISRGLSAQEKALKVQEILKMTQVGVSLSGQYNNEYEYGLCNLGILLNDDRPNAFIKSGDKVAVILLTNEDDYSTTDYDSTSSRKNYFADCPFAYNASGYSDYSVSSDSTFSVHIINSVSATFTTGDGQPITKRVDGSSTSIELSSEVYFSPSEAIADGSTTTFGQLALSNPTYNLCSNTKLRAKLVDAFSREHGYNKSAISILRCQANHDSQRNSFSRSKYEDPCTQSYEGYSNGIEYVRQKGYWMSSSNFCLTSHSPTRWVGGSDRISSVVHLKDLYPGTQSYSEIVTQAIDKKIGSGSLYFAAILSENSQFSNCSPLKSQNKFRILSDEINRNNTSDIYSLCDNDYSNIIQNVSQYTQKLVTNSYKVNFDSSKEYLEKVIVFRQNKLIQELTHDQDYTIKGQTLTFKDYIPQPEDQYELIFHSLEEEY